MLPLGLAVILWSAAATLFAVRPVLPVDETRYLTVAWEMWLRGDWLVPHLNGAPYSHKPPLLFWLINLAWAAFGVSEFAARMTAFAGGAASAVLTGLLARLFWPRFTGIGAWSVAILAGTGLFTVFSSMVMFDALLTFCVLLSTLGMVLVWKRGRAGWWALVALGIGLGVLAKGPVDLLHALAIGALAPLAVSRPPPGGWARWYGGLAAAVAGGAAIALGWAIPAALAGGAAYADMILWGQTAGRVAHAFAHARPWYFYLLILPVLVWPWGWWPAFWRMLRGWGWWRGTDPETRFCIAWFFALIAAFSLVSGKQIHYLLPAVPALALIAARQTIDKSGPVARRDLLLPLLPMVLVGFLAEALGALAGTPLGARLPATVAGWVATMPMWPGWALLGFIGLLFVVTPVRAKAQAATIAASWTATVIVVHLLAAHSILPAYDWRRVSPLVRAHAACGVAWVGDYAGEVGFLARLRRPVATIDPHRLPGWLAAHPGGVALHVYRDPLAEAGRPADREWPYRSRRVGAWISPGAVAACR